MTTEELVEAFETTFYHKHPYFLPYRKEINKALHFAAKAHFSQRRKSGELFLTHPIAVAERCAMYEDVPLVVAALLHDTVEDDPKTSIEKVYAVFGEKIGFIVDALTVEPLFFHKKPSVVYPCKIKKLFAGTQHDIRCLLLKFADRDHNLETVHALSPSRQERMIQETKKVFEPLRELVDGLWSIEEVEEEISYHTTLYSDISPLDISIPQS